MSLTKTEIDAQLAHQREMLIRRQRNLRTLELREADYGINVPLDVVNQIDRLTKQIDAHKAEIDRLETLAVEDTMPLAEVEYQIALAEAWDNEYGHPTVSGRARLEFARLRLHIAPDRAKELELSIRDKLAIEYKTLKYKTIYNMDFRAILKWIQNDNSVKPMSILGSDKFLPFTKLMSLSPELALDFIVTHVAPKPFNVERIEFILHDVYFQEDYYERVAAVLKLKFGTKRPEWKAMDSSIGDDDIPF